MCCRDESELNWKFSYDKIQVVEQSNVGVEYVRKRGEKETASDPVGEAEKKCRTNQSTIFL